MSRQLKLHGKAGPDLNTQKYVGRVRVGLASQLLRAATHLRHPVLRSKHDCRPKCESSAKAVRLFSKTAR